MHGRRPGAWSACMHAMLIASPHPLPRRMRRRAARQATRRQRSKTEGSDCSLDGAWSSYESRCLVPLRSTRCGVGALAVLCMWEAHAVPLF